MRVPKNLSQGYVNNSKEKYTFQFDKVLNMHTKQESVFNEVAKEVVDSSLDGYNGTIFAYGQTGSGKTYTITGGAERVDDRGIIPRAISYIFNETKKRTLYKWKVLISYLEIYNNDGYDLLHENQGRAKNLEDLPKVKIRENLSKQFLLYNLSVHHVENEEEAMLLLLLGDENRVVAETPKNDASTRSHCIFMFQIESQKIGEDVKTLSKLHIVDLSGSEKPYKTELNGARMEEALNINLSLHFLEQVIVSLNKKEGHIPYRNSMMTMCLRDSLGGNCKTRMIATLSAELIDTMESISTSRFAQRVALIQNKAIKNEIEDPVVIIQKQKSEIEELKSELAILKGKDQKSVLEKDDLDNCKKIVDDYLKDDDYSKKINLRDMLMINEGFSIIKVYYKDLEKKMKNYSNNEVVLNNNVNMDRMIEFENANMKLNSEIDKLKEIIKRRDDEVKVLLGIIDKLKSGSDGNKRTLLEKIEQEDSPYNAIKNNAIGDVVTFNYLKENLNMNLTNNKDKSDQHNVSESKVLDNINTNKTQTANKAPSIPLQLLQEINSANSYVSKPVELNSEILSVRLKAYDAFKKNYIKYEMIQENLKVIEEKYRQGSQIGENFTRLKEKSLLLKNQV
jgi:kinesin family protein 6/9